MQLDPMVNRDLKEQLEPMVNLVQLVLRVHKEYKERRASRVKEDKWVNVDIQALKV